MATSSALVPQFRSRCRTLPIAPVLLACVFGLCSRSEASQSPKPSAVSHARTERPATDHSILTPDLQSRLDRLEEIKSTADPNAISAASKSALATAFRDMGRTDLVLNSLPAAIDSYRRSIDFENTPDTRLGLAEAYLEAKRTDEALAFVTDVLVADPENAKARYIQGKIWMVKTRYDEAVKSFRRVLDLNADSAASYLLGAALLQTKDYNDAKMAFDVARPRVSGSAHLHPALADAYGAAGYLDDYRRYSTRASETPTISRVMADAAYFESSFEQAHPTAHDRAQAQELQIRLRSVLASTLNDLAVAEAQQQKYSLALAHFHEAANWNPDLPGLLRNTGIAAARAEDYPECIRALRPVLAGHPDDNVVRSMLGTALFAAHEYGDAVQVFAPLGDSALQLHELAYSWAASLVHINKFTEATALLDKLQQQELQPEILVLVAQLWSQMGAYANAVESCHKALQLDPTLRRAHYMAGLALLHLDRANEAEQEFRGELRVNPDDTDTKFNLAFSLLQQSQNSPAVELLKQVVAQNQNHAEANYELGKELVTEGKSEDALNYLEAAVRLRPEFEPARYQLQAAYRSVGRKEDADREAKIYRALKARSRDITLPPPHETGTASPN